MLQRFTQYSPDERKRILSDFSFTRLWSCIETEIGVKDITKLDYPSRNISTPALKGRDAYGRRFMIFRIACSFVQMPVDSCFYKIGSMMVYFDGAVWKLREDYEAANYGIFLNEFGSPDSQKITRLYSGDPILFRNVTIQLATK